LRFVKKPSIEKPCIEILLLGIVDIMMENIYMEIVGVLIQK